jgi:integrase
VSVHGWIQEIGLDPIGFETHSIRRTKASLSYRRTKNLRAVQLLLGHSKLESTRDTLASTLPMQLNSPSRLKS